MIDVEKAVMSLECCMGGVDGLGCDRVPCPYSEFWDCEGKLHADALAVIKEQKRQLTEWEKATPFLAVHGYLGRDTFDSIPEPVVTTAATIGLPHGATMQIQSI